MRKRQLLLVEWDDITSHSNWEEANVVCESVTNPVLSVGWRVKSVDRKHLSITPMLDNRDQCSDRQTIPRGCIRKITKLEYVRGN